MNYKLFITGIFFLFGAHAAGARELPRIVNSAGFEAPLSPTDRAFIENRLARLNIDACRRHVLASRPRVDYRYLEATRDGEALNLYVRPDVMRSEVVVIVGDSPEGLVEYTNCNLTPILPVLSIIATAEIAGEGGSNEIQQAVLADNSFLTSHEPSYLMLRNDSTDSDASYLDFKVSTKHPVLPNAVPLNMFYTGLTDALEDAVPGDEEYFLQLYLSFSGRFSQYIGSRTSAPVVARSFNPSLFYRFWSSPDNYLDLGFGHESNGQRIDTPEGLERAREDFISAGEPAEYARDSLSRGWDYTGITWQRSWNERLTSRLSARHYLDHGPLQGDAEEYNRWEDGGARLRPRHRYHGLTLALQYNFNRSRCFLGTLPICFQQVELVQETGVSAPFEHNTVSIELTSDFFGLPIQLWGKTGYNSNLVDYYDHTTSWGLGLELFSR